MQGVYGFKITATKPAVILEAIGEVFWQLATPEETDPEIIFSPEQWAQAAVRDPEQRATVENGSIITSGGTVVRVQGEPDGSITVEIELRCPDGQTTEQVLESLRDTLGPHGHILLMDRER